MKTITITKHLGGEVRRPKSVIVLQNGITYEEDNIIFATKPKMLSIGTINFLETIQYVKTTNVEIMDTYVMTTILEQEVEV